MVGADSSAIDFVLPIGVAPSENIIAVFIFKDVALCIGSVVLTKSKPTKAQIVLNLEVKD